MIKAVFRFIFFIPLGLTMTALSYLIAPFAVLLASEAGWLPHSLRIFQTPDNSLDGDKGWKNEHRLFRDSPKVDQGWRRWINRFLWLWRNPAHGFKREYLGFSPGSGFAYAYRGNQQTGNRPLSNGVVYRQATNPDGRTGFQFYFVRAWSKKYCLRINLGWKLWQSPPVGEYAQHVFSINPFMGYSL
ncbi:MAG: hypothetical protein LBV79_11190 [Candidatus Adiutrix sp.]|jgi:hypothetical protein|nr:hypothetical protein [Candidatus Adiutrix sp.]